MMSGVIFSPINGDCFLDILLMKTLVVSEIGKINIKHTIIICLLGTNS